MDKINVLITLKDYKWHKASEISKDTRQIRRLIEQLRREGYPIISDSNKGYRLLKRNEIGKLDELLKPYLARALKMIKTYYVCCNRSEKELIKDLVYSIKEL